MSSRARVALVLAAVVVAVVGAKAGHFADAQFWDENCYIGQARFIALEGTHWPAYRALELVRPPVFTTLLAMPTWLGHPSITWMHALTCLLVSLLLPVTFLLTRRLGGSTRAAYVATGLLLATPLYVAQIGLAESDGPTTLLTTLAWLVLLDGHLAAFVTLAIFAVWTKESAYFLCGPAALLLYARSGRFDWRGLTDARRLLGLWPAAVPGLALFGWLVCHRLLVGVAIPAGNGAMVGPSSLPEALLHDCLKDGRFALFALACLAARRATRAVAEPQLLDVRLTLAAALAVPLFFMAPLPRYMMPSLPLLCALAALTLDALPKRRTLASAAVVLVLVGSWTARNWYSDHGLYFDRNLSYRPLLAAQEELAHALAEAHPRGVLATFPLFEALSGPPTNHFLEAPLPTTRPVGGEPLATLCAHDYLVQARQSVDLSDAVRRLGAVGALSRWRSFGDEGIRIDAYRVHCPDGTR